MEPHVHITPVHILATMLAIVAIFGTLHLLALSSDNRWGRAFLGLGF
jgi:hypothetical protein